MFEFDFIVIILNILRVDLIGGHNDYSGYSVHPMAIEQDILVAVARQDAGIGLVVQTVFYSYL